MSLSLVKNRPTSLVNPAGTPVSDLFVGIGWDNSAGDRKGLLGKIKKARGVDLDLACLVYDTNDAGVRICGFDTMSLYSGALVHTGDNRTGKGDGIDEAIKANLGGVQTNVKTLIFTLNAFKRGVSFAQIAGADCHLIDESSGAQTELDMFSVPIDDPTKSTIVMAKVARTGSGAWQVTIINEMADVNGSPELLQMGKRFVSSS